jgi:hypothetical protein
MTTTRCTPAERKAFKGYITLSSGHIHPITEPALGTLEQRLDIIIRRLGGGSRIVVGPRERQWLKDHGWA